MFTVIYIDFFSLHQIDLKLTTLFILGAFRDLAESPGVTSNKNVIRACGIGTVQHALLKKQQNPREGSAVFNWVKKIRDGLI